MKDNLLSAFKILLNFVYPKYCYFCKTGGRYICANCVKSYLNINWEHRCHVCGKVCKVGFIHKECEKYTYLDGLIYVLMYDDAVKRIIYDIKYGFNFDILSEIGEMMGKYLRLYKFSEDAVLVSVPLHKRKLKYRGFNQAGILAKKIEKVSGFSYLPLLERVRDTDAQANLGREERENNLRDVFTCKNLYSVKHKKIIIIDDIYTTGVTMRECAKLLKKCGAEKVYGFVFAKSRE